HREGQVCGLVVGIDGIQVLRRDGDRSTLCDRQIEVAGNGRRDVADLGAEIAARLHGKLSVLYVAGDRAGAADADQVLDDHIALHSAVHVRLVYGDRAVAASALVNQERL